MANAIGMMDLRFYIQMGHVNGGLTTLNTDEILEFFLKGGLHPP
jgi:hypothetical protein